jgi:carbonic anhydrase
VVTEDVIRSLAISQRLLGTREVIVIQHTGCGMMTFTDEEFRHSIERETGIRPAWRAHAFPDLAGSVRRGVAHIAASPFLPHRDHVRGFVWDVATGALDEVGCDQVRESA